MRGRLVSLEGREASGKSTQAQILARRLGAVLTREPGGTALGERIRSLLLDPEATTLDARAEALLMAADRAQHVTETILPALEAGRHVVTDRYSHSSLVYQGHGRGLPVEEVGRVSDWAAGGLSADLVVLVDVPEDVARRRRVGSDRFELEDQAFHRRVADGYRRLAAEDPELWRVVDGTGTVEEVAARVWAVVEAHLAR
ncbi:MAG TPA: dTMP kinase [Acidimicrobiales bacterium]|nr:dTMP kinase [Acidimicrobiales bacterium]